MLRGGVYCAGPPPSPPSSFPRPTPPDAAETHSFAWLSRPVLWLALCSVVVSAFSQAGGSPSRRMQQACAPSLPPLPPPP
eukprot:2695088-Rhodomonas_salina.2